VQKGATLQMPGTNAWDHRFFFFVSSVLHGKKHSPSPGGDWWAGWVGGLAVLAGLAGVAVWLVGWIAGGLAGWLAGWLVG